MEKTFNGISRRDFLKYCAGLAAILGLSELYVPKIAKALEKAAIGKTPVIWMQGQTCSGCFVSFINSGEPTPAEIILDTISLRFQPTIMAASGDQALSTIEEAMTKSKGQYVFAVDGSIPTEEDGVFCVVGEKNGEGITIKEWVEKVSKDALVNIAIGTCAAYGGIPAAGVTGAKSVQDILGKDTPVVNVPGCAPHPDWMVGTITKLLLFGKSKVIKDLDGVGRPKDFFGTLIHDNCPRRHWFEAGEFLTDWNDPEQDGRCLLLKGCKGPVTHSDCPKRKWNEGVNWCIDANHPCIGCCEPAFYKGLAPIYEKLPDVKIPGIKGVEWSADKIGAALGIGTAAGIGAHLVGQVATGRLGKGGSEVKAAKPKKEKPKKDKKSKKSKAKLKKGGEE